MFWVIELSLNDSGPYITRCASFQDGKLADKRRYEWGEQNTQSDRIAIVKVYLK